MASVRNTPSAFLSKSTHTITSVVKSAYDNRVLKKVFIILYSSTETLSFKNVTITSVMSSLHSASVNPIALCFAMNLLMSSLVRQPSSSS